MSAQNARGRRSHLNTGPDRSTPSQPNMNSMHRRNKKPANVSTQDSLLTVTLNENIRMMIHFTGKRSEASRCVLACASEYITSEAD
jgi:hypothetical protein